MKVRSYISPFLLVCFSVFLGHNLIPHHHHSEQVQVPLAAECPIDHGDTHEHDHDGEEHPLHCHAFNDVVFHKYNSVQIPVNSQDITTLLHPLTLKESAPPSARNISSLNIQIKIPDKLLAYFGARSLRAPPHTV